MARAAVEYVRSPMQRDVHLARLSLRMVTPEYQQHRRRQIMKNQTRRQHRWRQGLQWAAGVVVSLMVLVVVGTTIYVHVSPVPAMLTLPKDAGSGSGTVLPSGGVTGEGVWKATPGSIVGWRVPQIFIGQQLPLVSRTGKVWGSITLSGGSVTRGTFTAD